VVPVPVKTGGNGPLRSRRFQTYEGEGIDKVWDKGETRDDGEVYELFENGSPKLRKYWGESQSKPQSTWWVKIKLPDGKIGWTKDTDNFGNMDACGG